MRDSNSVATWHGTEDNKSLTSQWTKEPWRKCNYEGFREIFRPRKSKNHSHIQAYNIPCIRKLLWKKTVVNSIPARPIMVFIQHLRNYFLFLTEVTANGFLIAFLFECSPPLLLGCFLIKPHRISDPSSTKACSGAWYFSGEALLSAALLSLTFSFLSQLTPSGSARPSPRSLLLSPHLCFHWGSPS